MTNPLEETSTDDSRLESNRIVASVAKGESDPDVFVTALVRIGKPLDHKLAVMPISLEDINRFEGEGGREGPVTEWIDTALENAIWRRLPPESSAIASGHASTFRESQNFFEAGLGLPCTTAAITGKA